MTRETNTAVEMIPVDGIAVLNPRSRDKKVFQAIVDSISRVGLKQPITVTRSKSAGGSTDYNLVCGQGRLEAFKALGEQEIAAFVVEATEEACMLMSLVENIARRNHRPMELLRDIGRLSKGGYSDKDIGDKIGLSHQYVSKIRRLMEIGEVRLLEAVEKGQMPINVAAAIADAGDRGKQEMLAEIYRMGFRGKQLLQIRRQLEKRERWGRGYRRSRTATDRKALSPARLTALLEKEAEKQRMMFNRAELVQNQLVFLVSAMRTFLADENFLTLLRAERLETMPRILADRIEGGEA